MAKPEFESRKYSVRVGALDNNDNRKKAKDVAKEENVWGIT